MTPEREAQMHSLFEKWIKDPKRDVLVEDVGSALAGFLACARALEPMVRDGERYRFLFDQSFKTWACDPLWPLVGFFRDCDETITKTIIDLAIDAALEDGNAIE